LIKLIFIRKASFVSLLSHGREFPVTYKGGAYNEQQSYTLAKKAYEPTDLSACASKKSACPKSASQHDPAEED
jgi:hypothetical protein